MTVLPTRGSSLSLLFALLMPGVSACAGDPPGDEHSGEDLPLVVASIFPVGDLARAIAADDVHVEVLLPARASPSTYEPTARQMALLAGAAGYLFVGGGMDRWAERLIQPGDGGEGEAQVVRLTDRIDLLEGHAHEGDPGTGNPHVWLDPVLVRDELLPQIEEVLARAAPEHASRFAERRALLADSLSALDAEIRTALAAVPSRAFVSTHSAWGYFARRYHLVEVGAVYESPGREPSSRHLAELVDGARAQGVRAVFVEPQLGEAGARAVASELGVGVHLLDPQGGEDQPGRDGYLPLLRFNTRQLVAALGGAS